jgi:hypothetical protein
LNLADLRCRGHHVAHRLRIVSGGEHGPQRQRRALQRLVEGRRGPIATGACLLRESCSLGDVFVWRDAQERASVGGTGRHRLVG